MAFYSGSANSYVDLLTALTNSCVIEGWVLSSGILSKGAAFFKLSTNAEGILIQGGTSQAGSTLNDASPQTPRLGRLHSSLGAQPVWPMAYSIHIGTSPDEVYLIVRHNVDYFYWMSFGISDVPGLLGTGAWLAAIACVEPDNYTGAVGGVRIGPEGSGTDTFQSGVGTSAAPFWKTNNVHTSKSQNTLHALLDGVAWSDQANSAGPAASRKLLAVAHAAPHITRSPSTWNSETPLTPIQVYYTRDSEKISLVADLKHARYLRVDNYNPEQIITLGADRWKVYPFYRKNLAQRDGQIAGGLIDHTGSFGWAIRYDGP